MALIIGLTTIVHFKPNLVMTNVGTNMELRIITKETTVMEIIPKPPSLLTVLFSDKTDRQLIERRNHYLVFGCYLKNRNDNVGGEQAHARQTDDANVFPNGNLFSFDLLGRHGLDGSQSIVIKR